MRDKDSLAFLKWYGSLNFPTTGVPRYGSDLFSIDTDEGNLFIHPEPSISLMCNDTFAWGSADAEIITEENLTILKEITQLISDYVEKEFEEIDIEIGRVDDGDWNHTLSTYRTVLADLFASRVRKMRPQGAAYKRYPEKVWHLFNEAGPEREIGIGNPYTPEGYKSHE